MKEAEKIANLLSSASWELLWPTLLTVFVAIVGVYFYSRIKKSAELKEINNNFETVLQQQEKLVKQSEDIRLALAKDSIYYEIQIRSYKEKSVNSIDIVYQELLNLKKAALDTSFLMNKEVCSDFVKCVSHFRDTFELHRIWLPHNLADKIENLAIEIDNRCNKYRRKSWSSAPRPMIWRRWPSLRGS